MECEHKDCEIRLFDNSGYCHCRDCNAMVPVAIVLNNVLQRIQALLKAAERRE